MHALFYSQQIMHNAILKYMNKCISIDAHANDYNGVCVCERARIILCNI